MNQHSASQPPESDTPASQPVHRSRWRRFSPSMGWRTFWSEIVIVVLGVVIALAANEAVEEWNWRHKVADAETRLQGDVDWAFLWAAEKSSSQPCVDAQLVALARTVLESGDALAPSPVITNLRLQYMVRMPNRPYRFPVWDALLADGTANHFAPERQAFYGRISDGMALSRAYEVETRRLGGNLLVIRDPIPLDPGVRAELLTRINDLRSIYTFEMLNARQRMRLIDDAGSAPADAIVERFLNAAGEHASGADYSGMAYYCKSKGLPLGDWRDFHEITANLGAPGQGAAK
jgi:hypothetical protein